MSIESMKKNNIKSILQALTLVENGQESSLLLKQLGRLILITLQQELKSHTDTALVEWHFMKSVTTRKVQSC